MPLKDFFEKYEYKPDEFNWDEFKAAALEEFGSDEGVWTAKVDDVQKGADQTAEELRKAKVHNYDLLRMMPGEKESSGAPKLDADPEPTIDDFFGKKKEEAS